MRIPKALLVALILAGGLAAACGGGKQKPESPLVKESGPPVSDSCCCKSNPLTAEDGKAVFENANRMECSSKQGACVAEGMCVGKPEPD